MAAIPTTFSYGNGIPTFPCTSLSLVAACHANRIDVRLEADKVGALATQSPHHCAEAALVYRQGRSVRMVALCAISVFGWNADSGSQACSKEPLVSFSPHHFVEGVSMLPRERRPLYSAIHASNLTLLYFAAIHKHNGHEVTTMQTREELLFGSRQAQNSRATQNWASGWTVWKCIPACQQRLAKFPSVTMPPSCSF